MFEQPTGNEEKDRSRTVMILSGFAVGLVVVLIILATTVAKRPAPLELVRSGSPEFDSYTGFVRIENINKTAGVRLNARFGHITCKVENSGDKTLSALELRATAIDLSDVVVREKLITPVPKIRATLGPNQSMDIDVYLEPIPDPVTLKDMIIEVYGLKVR